MHHYHQHLHELRFTLDPNSENYLLVYDDIERLSGLIPDFEQQIKTLTEEASSLVHQ